MPMTINSPNFWELSVDNLINNTDRMSHGDGTYSFVQPLKKEKTVTDPYTRHLMPWPEESKHYTPKDFYNMLMDMMTSEAEDGDIPYNSQRTMEGANPDVLDSVKRWIAGGGARKYKY